LFDRRVAPDVEREGDFARPAVKKPLGFAFLREDQKFRQRAAITAT
jgi:hypothetical protein